AGRTDAAEVFLPPACGYGGGSGRGLFRDDAIFAGPLRSEEVLVGALEEGERVVLLRAIGGNTGADGEVHGWNAVGFVDVRAVADLGEDALSHLPGGVQLTLRDDDAEFVAAVANYDVRFAAVALDEIGKVAEHAIADPVAVVVVDHLEVVQV